MKNKLFKSMLGLLFLFGVSFIFIQCEDEIVLGDIISEQEIDLAKRNDNPPATINVCDCIADNFPSEAINPTEKDALLFMREEEKFARDVYLYLAEKWELKIFSNIARAEDRHMASVLCLLDKYDLSDPVMENPNGVFTNEELGVLYNTLIERGTLSMVDALKVGALVEDLDINDLNLNIENELIDNEDVLAVFGELRKGSRNHMRAFTRNLTRLGEIYEVQYITPELYASIIDSSKEKGGEICKGMIDCPNNGVPQNGTCDGKGNGKNNGNRVGNGNCDGKGMGTNVGTGNGSGTCDGTGLGNSGNRGKKNKGN